MVIALWYHYYLSLWQVGLLNVTRRYISEWQMGENTQLNIFSYCNTYLSSATFSLSTVSTIMIPHWIIYITTPFHLVSVGTMMIVLLHLQLVILSTCLGEWLGNTWEHFLSSALADVTVLTLWNYVWYREISHQEGNLY